MSGEIVALRGLAARRKAAGLTQSQLAERLFVSRQSIDFWERGVKWPTPDRLPAIAEALGCSIDELYREPEVAGCAGGAGGASSAPTDDAVREARAEQAPPLQGKALTKLIITGRTAHEHE
ncbi:MAG: helix-turn-helix transcriptional regulator [Firmicutes bacterium]|nr:helix-turn-helix transcriptional regulator [Bacillota bacterium]